MDANTRANKSLLLQPPRYIFMYSMFSIYQKFMVLLILFHFRLWLWWYVIKF